MEIEILITKMKKIYSSIMEFLDSTENPDLNLLNKIFEEQEILKNKSEIISTLQLLSKISDNHHLLPDFIEKFNQIIQYLIQAKISHISDFEIYEIFKNNKRILLLLLEQKIIRLDANIISNIFLLNDENNFPYKHYLYSGIKSFIDEEEKNNIESEIKQNYDEEITKFEEKCRIGENDTYICTLIRQDSVEEFISYVNRTNTSLSSQIQPSIFETNSFLIRKNPTLIEYAGFFGSIQIIQYLKYSRVSLTESLWFLCYSFE